VKLPIPAPSLVLLSAIEGVESVLQQTPRRANVAPPSEIIIPPHSAVVCVISLTAAVLTTGTCASGSMGLFSEHETNRRKPNAVEADNKVVIELLNICKYNIILDEGYKKNSRMLSARIGQPPEKSRRE
jgi:hypothetical protein